MYVPSPPSPPPPPHEKSQTRKPSVCLAEVVRFQRPTRQRNSRKGVRGGGKDFPSLKIIWLDGLHVCTLPRVPLFVNSLGVDVEFPSRSSPRSWWALCSSSSGITRRLFSFRVFVVFSGEIRYNLFFRDRVRVYLGLVYVILRMAAPITRNARKTHKNTKNKESVGWNYR